MGIQSHHVEDKNIELKEGEVLEDLSEIENKQSSTRKPKIEIVWKNVIIAIFVHILSIYGFYLFLFKALWLTDLFACFLIYFTELGITAGVHRLWSHKSYKARLPLQILLLIMNTTAFQEPVKIWVRDHRLHHKYSDTDADPYNSRRGLFFSHIGWLLVKKHPDIKIKGKSIDISDITSDPLVMFQKRYFYRLVLLACFIIPTCIPTLWNESMWNAFFVCVMFRHIYTLNGTWLINSAAHAWGDKPYDKNIAPTQNKLVSWFTFGEGFHNYHHTFPWDYKAAELGGYSLNATTLFIDFMAAIGWAYDLKCVASDMVLKRIHRTGDGSN